MRSLFCVCKEEKLVCYLLLAVSEKSTLGLAIFSAKCSDVWRGTKLKFVQNQCCSSSCQWKLCTEFSKCVLGNLDPGTESLGPMLVSNLTEGAFYLMFSKRTDSRSSLSSWERSRHTKIFTFAWNRAKTGVHFLLFFHYERVQCWGTTLVLGFKKQVS